VRSDQNPAKPGREVLTALAEMGIGKTDPFASGVDEKGGRGVCTSRAGVHACTPSSPNPSPSPSGAGTLRPRRTRTKLVPTVGVCLRLLVAQKSLSSSCIRSQASWRAAICSRIKKDRSVLKHQEESQRAKNAWLQYGCSKRAPDTPLGALGTVTFYLQNVLFFE
jgi:hypothetical protein